MDCAFIVPTSDGTAGVAACCVHPTIAVMHAIAAAARSCISKALTVRCVFMGLLTPDSCIRHHHLFARLQPRNNFGLGAVRCTNANLALGLRFAHEHLDGESPLLLLDGFVGHKDAIGKGSANHQARLNAREHTSINAAQRCNKWERSAIAFWRTNNYELINHCLATKLGARWKPNSGNITLLHHAQGIGVHSAAHA
jgi:hypothetical protein